MFKIMERGLFEEPVLYVHEEESSLVYSKIYSTENAFPLYVHPKIRIIDEREVSEFLFLPITTEEFKNNKEEYFFGFRYRFFFIRYQTVSLIKSPEAEMTTLQLEHTVNRIRYHPEGDKTIVISRDYDPLFPTSPLQLQGPSYQMNEKITSCVNQYIDIYSYFYSDRKV